MNSKTFYLLIGQKGSGKSFIGAIFDREFGIRFIRVEDWAIRIRKERAVNNEAYLKQVFEAIEKGIRDCLDKTDKLVFESTGLTEYFDQMVQNLNQDFLVKTIGIRADRVLCLERVKSRDQAIHINVSDKQVLMINEKVRERNYKTDFYIDNENKSEMEIVSEIKIIIEQTLKQ